MRFARLCLRTAGALVCISAFAIPVCSGQVITTVAGGGGELADNGPATNAQLQQPSGVAFDSAGNMYIADPQDQRVRKVSPTGTITTFAGNGNRGFSGDGGAATSAMLNGPHGVAVDASDNLYIGDQLNSRIRKVTPAGIITTVAGIATAGFSGDGGPAVSAALNGPTDVAFDNAGIFTFQILETIGFAKSPSAVQSPLWRATATVSSRAMEARRPPLAVPPHPGLWWIRRVIFFWLTSAINPSCRHERNHYHCPGSGLLRIDGGRRVGDGCGAGDSGRSRNQGRRGNVYHRGLVQ